MLYQTRYTTSRLILSIMLIAGLARAQTKMEAPNDSSLKEIVKVELAGDDAVSAHLIDVSADNGIVELSGTVNDLLSKDRAEKIVESLKGVRAIRNKLEVRPVERTASEIRNDVQMALLVDPVTELFELSVGARGDTVILEGRVQSLAEKELVTKVVKNVKGIRHIYNNVDVVPKLVRSNLEIREEVQERLKNDPYVREEMIDVKVKSGVVSLSGTTGSLSEKAFAHNDALVMGVSEINDDKLDVELWAESPLRKEAKSIVKSGEKIKKDLQAVFKNSPRLADAEIDIDVKKGAVTLKGNVDNLAAKRLAEHAALDVVGVYNVRNALKVRPDEIYEDEEIKESIAMALQWNPVVERHEISIDVRNSKAYIYGEVDSRYEKEVAGSVCEEVLGVVDVANYLRIRRDVEPWNYLGDEVISSNIKGEYYNSWYVDQDDLDIEVEEGVATISGDIESKRELNAIVENAFDGGARAVRTRLDLLGLPDYGYYRYREYYPLN
ncbi:MAG: BON domain-containing protein [Chitinivibrionales bacterium]|nr:BON domain-containing protein [Chitinivibrionales bacterium]